MRTSQYALILVTQIVLLCVTFSFEAKLVDDWRHQNALSDSSGVQGPGDQDNLVDYLSR